MTTTHHYAPGGTLADGSTRTTHIQFELKTILLELDTLIAFLVDAIERGSVEGACSAVGIDNERTSA